MSNIIQASAPGKLLLFGDHAVVYGKPCIVTAVNERVFVTVENNNQGVFKLFAPDLGLAEYSKNCNELGKGDFPKSAAFVEMCYRRFLEKYPQNQGITVSTKSDFSAQFGFGSSSAVTVAFAKALTTLYKIELSQKKLFELCYQSVLDVQGVGSGFDIASAIWGGTIYYVTPAKVVRLIDESELPLVVGYTGIKADTPTVVRMVKKAREENLTAINGIFQEISKIVNTAEGLIAKKQWSMVGKLMTDNQHQLQKLNVSSLKLDKLIQAALESGAFGAKLSGAGVGDCMIALAKDKLAVEQAIKQAGGVVLNVETSAQGVRIESVINNRI